MPFIAFHVAPFIIRPPGSSMDRWPGFMFLRVCVFTSNGVRSRTLSRSSGPTEAVPTLHSYRLWTEIRCWAAAQSRGFTRPAASLERHFLNWVKSNTKKQSQCSFTAAPLICSNNLLQSASSRLLPVSRCINRHHYRFLCPAKHNFIEVIESGLYHHSDGFTTNLI